MRLVWSRSRSLSWSEKGRRLAVRAAVAEVALAVAAVEEVMLAVAALILLVAAEGVPPWLPRAVLKDWAGDLW